MEDLELLCMGCMKIKPDKGECPYCHFDLEKYMEKTRREGIYHLQPQTILNGRYMVGKVLGEGGFGITYIGWNLNLEIPIAIKEHFPNGFVTRNINQADTVSILSGGGKEQFVKKQRTRFLDEARTLAKLDRMDAIVSVKEFFEENGTAYIVMEYLDGEDFGSFLKKNGGKIPAEQVFWMMRPVMKALSAVHSKGLMHRDISPDNIRILEDLKVKLMDFGAAREMSDGEKSLSILLKPGYAPIEQYQTRGNQGAWTDIYSLCATIYRAITGKKPMESLNRVIKDELKTPSQLGIDMNPAWEAAIMKGLAIMPQDRWQSVDELYDEIYSSFSDPYAYYSAYSNYTLPEKLEEKKTSEKQEALNKTQENKESKKTKDNKRENDKIHDAIDNDEIENSESEIEEKDEDIDEDEGNEYDNYLVFEDEDTGNYNEWRDIFMAIVIGGCILMFLAIATR